MHIGIQYLAPQGIDEYAHDHLHKFLQFKFGCSPSCLLMQHETNVSRPLNIIRCPTPI